MIIEKAKSFCNEVKIIGQWTFAESWLQNFKIPAAEGDIQMKYYSD
jgi:hypothetical protein